MTDLVSVIIPTYNPQLATLQKTLLALQNQTLPKADWELIIVDNNSEIPVNIDLSWQPNGKTVVCKSPGLTQARLTGFKQSTGNIIVMVDDDNMLDETYLKNAGDIFNSYKHLGAAGGKSIPAFEVTPPQWLSSFYDNLALRNLGENVQTASWTEKYPAEAPIGAGMIVRRAALTSYLQKTHTISDRTGANLTSGGDNDMVIEVLKSGWQVGYFPSLSLQHIIPTERMQLKYIAKLVNNTNKSWVQLLQSHHINPWQPIAKWTTSIRKTKAWFTYKAWKNETSYIKWRGACGMFDGLASIKANHAE